MSAVTFRRVISTTPYRGGTIVMIKNYLTRYVSNVDYSTDADDQVWVKLKCILSVIFGFCYILPRD